jgi:hypothetical protein
MEAFMHNGYRGKELRELNKCSLYLQCANLMDITNGKGDKILAAAIQCCRSALIEQKQYKWPTLPASNKLQKLLWRKALHKCFTLHRRTNALQESSHQIRPWQQNVLYPNRGRTMATSPKRPTQTPTRFHLEYTANHLRRTTPTEHHERQIYWWQNWIIRDETGTVAGPRAPDIQARMDPLGELKWSVQNLQIQGDLNRLLQTIEDGTDGS